MEGAHYKVLDEVEVLGVAMHTINSLRLDTTPV